MIKRYWRSSTDLFGRFEIWINLPNSIAREKIGRVNIRRQRLLHKWIKKPRKIYRNDQWRDWAQFSKDESWAWLRDELRFQELSEQEKHKIIVDADLTDEIYVRYFVPRRLFERTGFQRTLWNVYVGAGKKENSIIECPTTGWTSLDLNAVKNNPIDHCLLHSTDFPFVDFVQNFSDSRKKAICRPELLSLEVLFKMPKQEKIRKSDVAKSG
jgi:hypothetical protein